MIEIVLIHKLRFLIYFLQQPYNWHVDISLPDRYFSLAVVKNTNNFNTTIVFMMYKKVRFLNVCNKPKFVFVHIEITIRYDFQKKQHRYFYILIKTKYVLTVQFS